MYKYVRVKAWFLQKNNKYAYNNNDRINGYKFTEHDEFVVKKETEKAVLINANGDLWCPKSAIIETTESEFSPIQKNCSDEWKKLYLSIKNDTKEELQKKYEEATKKFKEICKLNNLSLDKALETEEYKYMDFLAKQIK